MADRPSSVFIIGSPRSGTTALSRALAEHPALWTSPESNILFYLLRTPFIEEQYKATLETYTEGTWLTQLNISYEEFASYLGKGLDLLWRSRSGDRIWIDATPAYTNIAPKLMVYFPQARFIHIIRDGRAVVSSMLKTNFPYPAFNDFKLACQSWVHYVSKAQALMADFPGRVMELRNEDLVEDPDRELGRLFDFLGLEFSVESADFIRTKRVASSYLNVEKDDIRTKVKSPADMPREPWKEWTEEQRTIFSTLCGGTMSTLGYGWPAGHTLGQGRRERGFYAYEEGRTWIGREAVVTLNTGASGSLLLEGYLPRFLLPNGITILCGSEVVHQQQFKRANVRLHIHTGSKPGSEQQVTIRMDRAVRPVDAGFNEDSRELGMLISKLEFEAPTA